MQGARERHMKIKRSNPSEATIQAELYCALKTAGFQPVLEQVARLSGKTRRAGRAIQIRADLMVVQDGEAIAAIEVKNTKIPTSSAEFQNTRQYLKYVEMGLPFRYCTHLSEIEACVHWVRWLSNRQHVSKFDVRRVMP